MKVRNLLYDNKSYKGKEIEALYPFCPCLRCYLIYDFPYYIYGKKYQHFDCVTKVNKGCPKNLRPMHIFYLSKRFRNRKKGDKFRCLRCGMLVEFGKNDFDFIAVPFRKKEKILDYLIRLELK